MKLQTRPFVLASALIAIVGGFVTGCQSTTSPALTQGASASASLQDVSDTIHAARIQVGMTTAALRNLADRPQDIPAQYQTVVDQYNILQKQVEKIASGADKMRSVGDKYLADWAKQVSTISDEDLRSAALARRGEVSDKLQVVYKSFQNVKSAYEPYISHLKDIQKVLGTDLSAAGLATVKPFVDKASADSVPLKDALVKLATDFQAASAGLQPGGK